MDSLRKPLLGLGLILICIVAITGCTKKDNLTGDNWSDVHALTAVDSLGLNMPFSFAADTLITIDGDEGKLLIGNYRNAHAQAYLRFTGLPDMEGLSFQHEDSLYLSLKVTKRSPMPRNPITLKLYKTNQAWTDTLSHLDETAFTPISGAEIQVNEVPLTGTTVKLPLSFNALFNWQCPEDSVGFNLMLKTEDEGYVEISSAETSYDPVMYLKYKYADDDEYSTYEKAPAKDVFLLDAPEATGYSPFMVDNLSPRRLYIKYTPTTTIFKDMQGNALSALQLKQMTINEAKLVLYIKDNSYYTGATLYNLFPLNVKGEVTITEPRELLTSDCERMVQTVAATGLADGDSIEIDITPIVQAYTSGDRTPNGIVLLSQHERQNFGYLEFWDCLSTTPDELKPFIRIKYTPPFLP